MNYIFPLNIVLFTSYKKYGQTTWFPNHVADMSMSICTEINLLKLMYIHTIEYLFFMHLFFYQW